jgi:glycosyltransferase involved in cell wall biosynthesis
VVLPFFNERERLPLALASLSAQTVPCRLILVDNGSTDTGPAYARLRLTKGLIDGVVITELQPGLDAALAAGLRLVDTPYAAACDAGAWYPPEYLAEAQRLLRRRRTVVYGAGTCFIADPARGPGLFRALHRLGAPRLLGRRGAPDEAEAGLALA